MKEVCSCTAALEIANTQDWSTKALLEVFKEWRENHLHDMPAPIEEPPHIHESGSSHERVGEFFGAEDRVAIGFQRNP